MTWLGLVAGLITALTALVNWLRSRSLVDAGQAQAAAAHLQEAQNEIVLADATRTRVRDRLLRDPDSLRDDDGFERPG